MLEDGGAGAAVLNDCKYGVSTAGNEIRLTLMKAPLMPDMYADRREQEFTYSFFPFLGPFTRSDVLREACELNEPPVLGRFLPAGEERTQRPVLVSGEKNIIVDAVKPADTAENAILVRAYEAMGMGTEASFAVAGAVRRVDETDMLEENASPLPLRDGGLRAAFGPFEIKTFLLYL